jgi:hypothetical protein
MNRREEAIGSRQAIRSLSDNRAGERGGARAGKPRWARIFAMKGSTLALSVSKYPSSSTGEPSMAYHVQDPTGSKNLQTSGGSFVFL